MGPKVPAKALRQRKGSHLWCLAAECGKGGVDELTLTNMQHGSCERREMPAMETQA